MDPVKLHRRYFDLKILLIIVFMILSIVAATSSQAQDKFTKHKSISLGFSGLAGIPLGDFFYESSQIYTWGLNTSVFYHPERMETFYVGLGFTYLNYGMENYDKEVEIDGNLYSLETLRNYNILFPYFNIRLRPWDHYRLVPVFDAFIGPRAFTTVSTSAIEEDPDFLTFLFGSQGDQEIIREMEHKDWTWGYGFSVGMNYLVCTLLELELMLSYTKGGEVNYLTKTDIIRQSRSGSFSYHPRRSETDILTLGLGVRFNLF